MRADEQQAKDSAPFDVQTGHADDEAHEDRAAAATPALRNAAGEASAAVDDDALDDVAGGNGGAGGSAPIAGFPARNTGQDHGNPMPVF